MNKLPLTKLAVLFAVVALFCATAELRAPATSAGVSVANLSFDVSFSASASNEPLDGRLLLLLSNNNNAEPKLQISEDLTTQQVFGIDVDGWRAGQTKVLDQSAFGYPVHSLSEVPPGEYWVQALLHRYETFRRSDGHTI